MEKIKCTVVIPTYNRPNHLKRILSYYYRYGNNLSILIADSSSDENKKRNRETVASFYDTSFSHLDKYDPCINGFHKVLDALQQVNTKYCALCADDDFVTPNGIQESVNFLDTNPDFTTVYGKGEIFVLEPGRGSESQFRYIMCHNQSNTYFEPKDRLIFEIASYEGTVIFGVRNADFMRMLFTETVKYAEGDLFAELLIVGLSAIYGKKKCLDTLYSVREACTPAHLRRTFTTFKYQIKDKSNQKEKQKFTDCMAGHLSKQSGINLVESCKIVDKALSVGVQKHPSSIMPKINRIVTNLNLPNWLDQGVRKLYRTAESARFSPADRAYSLTSQYYNDSNQIHLCVLSNAGDIYAHTIG